MTRGRPESNGQREGEAREGEAFPLCRRLGLVAPRHDLGRPLWQRCVVAELHVLLESGLNNEDPHALLRLHRRHRQMVGFKGYRHPCHPKVDSQLRCLHLHDAAAEDFVRAQPVVCRVRQEAVEDVHEMPGVAINLGIPGC